MRARVISSIEAVPAAQWNALIDDDNPFVRHEFLAALESTGCVGHAAGWMPQHLLVETDGALAAAMPLYRKTHSWGEFVFDWSWARAYEQAGLRYYPKLVSMAPFTPAPGPRLLVSRSTGAAAARQTLTDALKDLTREQQASSAHVLFINDADREALEDAGLLLRSDCQFHWHNRGYRDFADFLAAFRADKRKKTLRERRRISEAGVTFRTLAGEAMDAQQWNVVFGFSQATFAAHGNDHYLNVDFLRQVSAALTGAVIVKLAEHAGTPIAAAIFFRNATRLYGRYWGASAQYHSLHFETCYYQGIEYCIEHGLQHFEPGTQGEHKVPRGFEPTPTWSAHWIEDERFRAALRQYLRQEGRAVEEYMRQVREHVPFKRGGEQQEDP